VSATERVLLAVVIVLVDLVLFAVPLTALVAAWVIVARPPWFREWVARLYDST
jgi:hypothetical protein